MEDLSGEGQGRTLGYACHFQPFDKTIHGLLVFVPSQGECFLDLFQRIAWIHTVQFADGRSCFFHISPSGWRRGNAHIAARILRLQTGSFFVNFKGFFVSLGLVVNGCRPLSETCIVEEG